MLPSFLSAGADGGGAFISWRDGRPVWNTHFACLLFFFNLHLEAFLHN